MNSELTGKCIIFSAPSGAGKTTIVSHLLKKFPQLKFSISATSRLPRGKEINGVDYHFFSIEKFKSKIKCDDFIEWEEVYENNFYGTLKTEIEQAWLKKQVVVFDVDAIGGINLKKIFGNLAMSIFIKPPSIAALRERLKSRETESEDQIQMRINKAEEEMTSANKFDQIILNDNLKEALSEAETTLNLFLDGE